VLHSYIEKIQRRFGGQAKSETSGKSALRRAAVEIGIFSFIINALMLVIPLYMLQVYDRILPSSSHDTLLFLSLMAGAALILLAGLEIVRSIYSSRIATRFDIDQTRDAMLAAMASPRASLGDIQAMRDLALVRNLIGSRSVFALFDLPFAPLFIVLLLFVHPALFWLTAAGAIILALLAVLNQWASARAGADADGNAIAAMATAQSFVRNAETLRAMGMIGHAIGTFGKQHVVSLAASERAARMNALFSGFSRFLRLSLQIAILGLGALLVLQQGMTPGMIFAASIIAGRGLQPIDQVIGGWRHFVDVHAAWKRLRSATSEIAAKNQRTDLPAPSGTVTLENVSYAVQLSQDQEKAVLKGIDLNVEAGTIVGIIGPSGAGKSTLARLVAGAIQPTSGLVRFDGADMKHWSSENLGRFLGYLPQDVELLPGTVAQNIARFNPQADDASIVAAAKRAQVHDLIQTFPDGYDTIIGPQGLVLSGGQRQRVGLARAFFGEVRVIVLDEPNANLDAVGEAALERAIDEAKTSGITVLIVTQRKAIARKVDNLLVIRDGRIDDYGPRDEVFRRQQTGNGKSKIRGAAPRRQSQGRPSATRQETAPMSAAVEAQ
jgi:PrtD family type I secretion system ABC transporter